MIRCGCWFCFCFNHGPAIRLHTLPHLAPPTENDFSPHQHEKGSFVCGCTEPAGTGIGPSALIAAAKRGLKKKPWSLCTRTRFCRVFPGSTLNHWMKTKILQPYMFPTELLLENAKTGTSWDQGKGHATSERRRMYKVLKLNTFRNVSGTTVLKRSRRAKKTRLIRMHLTQQHE